ncbi:MAG: class I SAM-dependent methyltransferase [Solirubrobacteraceae bacterium]
MDETGPGRALGEAARRRLIEVSRFVPVDTGGGSSALKALVAADLIVTDGLSSIVEIGVWHGRFLLPASVALDHLGRGTAIGIDPYSATAAEQHDDHDRGIDLIAWSHEVNWDGVHAAVLQRVRDAGLEERVRIDRRTAAEAATDVAPASIDLLHVDGNHDAARVAEDVRTYLPKVRPGGYVLLDDCSWPSVAPSFAFLEAEHELLFRVFDSGHVRLFGEGFDDFAVFQVR